MQLSSSLNKSIFILRLCLIQDISSFTVYNSTRNKYKFKPLFSRFNKNVLIKKYVDFNRFHIWVLARMKAESPPCRYDSITYCHNCKKSYNIRRTTGNSIKKLYICIARDVINQAGKLAIQNKHHHHTTFSDQRKTSMGACISSGR